jgi:hypothetical protein
MTERVLILSGNPEWREALGAALQSLDAEAAETHAGRPWPDKVHAFRATAIVLHTENPREGAAAEERRSESEQVMTAVAARFSALPLILVTAAPRLELAAFVSTHVTAEMLLDGDADPFKLAQAVLSSAARLRPAPQLPPAPWAIIEIELGEAKIEGVVHAGVRTGKIGPFDWKRRDLELLNTEFHDYESDDDQFRQKVDRTLLENTGKRLLWHAFEEPLAQARAFCEKNVVKGGTLYHRFTVADNDLEFVPLELVATGNEGEYLRAVQPLVRRLKVREQHGDPDRPWRKCADDPIRVLFILADVEGALSLTERTFKKKETIWLERLKHIHTELERTIALYGEQNVKSLRLEEGQDAKQIIADALKQGRYDIVHFAGHSLRADKSNDVFLVLPGVESSSVTEYNAEDFARRVAAAGVRVVILSSCEGASCRAISRLASSGVPAVAGFRWKVDDRDAARFTPALHEALQRRSTAAPVVHAFHQALLALKESTEERLTWFSPVLMLQPTAFDNFWADSEV